MNRFAVLQLSGCAGCEVSLLNAGEWMDRLQLVYMPLVVSAYDVPPVDLLLVSGGVRTDEDLHNLRIDCKKLRYLLEFFTSLFPKTQMKLLIKQLKQLQDNLGDFNDLSVQQARLLEVAGELPADAPGTAKALVATGALPSLLAGTWESWFYGFEVLLGAAIPVLLMASTAARRFATANATR